MPDEHMNCIDGIASSDCEMLRHKEKTYRGSWKKRGGVGAFMMLARKWDRIEVIAEKSGYDIFSVIEREGLGGADGELISEIRDLRGYLLLVEAEMTARNIPSDTNFVSTEEQIMRMMSTGNGGVAIGKEEN